jgi:hypothetical protein
LGLLATNWQKNLAMTGAAGSAAPIAQDLIERARPLHDSFFSSPKSKNRSGLIDQVN